MNTWPRAIPEGMDVGTKRTDAVCIRCGVPATVVDSVNWACKRCNYITSAHEVYFRKPIGLPVTADDYWLEEPWTLHYQLVRAFMLRIAERNPACEIAVRPVMGTLEQRVHRAKLILEEVLETVQKGLGVTVEGLIESGQVRKGAWKEIGPGDMVELVDGICDAKVVLTGTLVQFGIADHEVQCLVDHNNLEKFMPGHGFDGMKLLKPTNHKPPAIREWLVSQGWRGI